VVSQRVKIEPWVFSTRLSLPADRVSQYSMGRRGGYRKPALRLSARKLQVRQRFPLALVGMYDPIIQSAPFASFRLTSVVPRLPPPITMTSLPPRSGDRFKTSLDHVNREEGIHLTRPEGNSVLLFPLHTTRMPSIPGFHARTVAPLADMFVFFPEPGVRVYQPGTRYPRAFMSPTFNGARRFQRRERC
jgi:hypothetical protein